MGKILFHPLSQDNDEYYLLSYKWISLIPKKRYQKLFATYVPIVQTVKPKAYYDHNKYTDNTSNKDTRNNY